MSKNSHLLVRTAQLYYEEHLTQANIGRSLNVSRSTVSRLLQEARNTGVVRIIINYPWKRNTSLEAALLERFQLKDARVLSVEDRGDGDAFDGIGALAASYLDDFVESGMVMGVSYGRSIAATITHLQPAAPIDMTFIQILGALNTGNPLIEGPDLVREMANCYGASYRYLYTPMIVENVHTRDLLLREPSVQSTLEAGRQADAVIIGIGARSATSSGLIWTGYLEKQELVYLRDRGAVGHMCAQHFDAEGNVLDVDFNHRVISIGIQALRNIETVIAVAGSKEKAGAILGALRGNYLDVLITDEAAAQEVARLAH